jgi:1,4-dihydroxy-2-naphthoate octaprenyltransferase
VAICYGPLICAGTYLVQRGSLAPQVVWLSLPLGLLIAGFLCINEFPDYRADRVAGKRTLVVRLGPRRAAVAFALIEGTAFLMLAVLPMLGLPMTVWLAALGIPPAVSAARRLFRNPESTPELIPAQAKALLAFSLFAVGAGVGLLA